jgi:hypothetical protein
MRRTHHNAFWELETLPTTSHPDLLHTLLAKMKATSVVLYLYLLGMMKKQKRSTVKIHTKDVLSSTGLHRETWAKAREELTKNKLVECVELTKKGLWQYQVLNPATGGSLPSRDNVDFAALSDRVVMMFYRRLLPPNSESNGRFFCPFGTHARPAFKVLLDAGSDEHGTWNCGKCHTFGGLVDFYRRLKDISRAEANRSVRAMLQTLIQEEAQLEPASVTIATTENSGLALA